MNEPIKHHYLPVFYLSRWAGTEGKVCRFSKPVDNEVKAKMLVPKGTGFEERLYETRGLPPEKAQAMEKDFMARIDSGAAVALSLLERGIAEADWTSEHRSSWSRFLLAQMMRAPADIAQLKSMAIQEWGEIIPELQVAYEQRRPNDYPASVDEFLRQSRPGQQDEFAFGIARKLIDSPGFGNKINNMRWNIVQIPLNSFSLLTSDKPVWMTTTLVEVDAFITIPIGPRKLFTATVDRSTSLKIMAHDKSQLSKVLNKIVVKNAEKFVYGVDNSMLPFVQKHMSSTRTSSLVERLALRRGHDIVSSTSPVLQTRAKQLR